MKIKVCYLSIFFFSEDITGTDYLSNLTNTYKLSVNATYANTLLFIDNWICF